MNSIYVCNAKEDSITKINLEDMSLETLHLRANGRLMGPSNIDVKGEIGVVANSYCNTISLLNMKDFKEIYSNYIGASPIDVKIYKKYVYVLCNELNSIVVYDLEERSTILKIPSGSSPQNMTVDENREIMLVSNLLDNTISVIDLKENRSMDIIKTELYPIKVKFSRSGKQFYILESSIETNDEYGYISIYKTEDFTLINKIKVGVMPIDLWEDYHNIYILDAGRSKIVKVNSDDEIEKKEMYISGMVKSIIKYEGKFYVSDYINNRLHILSKSYKEEKIITLGKEPNAMILVTSNHQTIS